MRCRLARTSLLFCTFFVAFLIRVTPVQSAPNLWQAAASMANAREGHTAILLQSGKVLVAGGSGSDVKDLASTRVIFRRNFGT